MSTRSLYAKCYKALGRRLMLRAALLVAGLMTCCIAEAQGRPEAINDTVPGQIVDAYDKLFGGPRSGERAVHANGIVCEGVFTPAPAAANLSRAEHLKGPDVPVLVRFSNRASIPGLPDGSPAASPRGLAIKFFLLDGSTTDVLAHSYNGFPASTPSEFLAFLRAAADPVTLEKFASGHPAARAFLRAPKPTPASYGSESYFGVSAFRFTNALGVSRYGRYRIVPVAGVSHLSTEQLAKQASAFLVSRLKDQLQQAPVLFRVMVQLASESDQVTDGAVLWPEDRPIVQLGTLSIRALVNADDPRQADLGFVPTNLVDGIDPSSDPMLLARTQAYSVSYVRRLRPQ